MLVAADPFFDTRRDRIIAFAAQQKLPAIYHFREYAVAGGLMSYGVSLSEAYRVLKPGAFLQFSITHPCFDTPHRRNLRDENGMTYAIEVGDYYRDTTGRIDEWCFKTPPPELRARVRNFRVPRFNRRLSEWLNMLIDAGFQIERLGEPRPSDQTVRACPELQDAQVVSFFLHVRVRK